MTQCHSSPAPAPTTKALKRVALLGMPNTGKSTFFNRITGANAFVGNWPGITVDLLQATVKINGETTEFVDLPGIYDLIGFSEDEKVIQTFFEKFAVDLVIIILNASQIDHQIRLALQIKALNLPGVVLLNMADEAKRYGISIDAEQLSTNLGMPVLLVSAKYGKGYTRAYLAISQALATGSPIAIPDLQLKLAQSEKIQPQQIDSTLAGAVTMPSKLALNFTARIDQIVLHPIFGFPIFLLGMFFTFWLVWNIGLPSQEVMDGATTWIQSTLLEPLASFLPKILQDFLINGLWAGFATVASFVPLIVLFFILMAFLEDSGYLSRSAYLMDALMSKLGLDGRSFVLQMMGFGCNVPALMGARVMRSRALRLLTMLIIPFALCSARLQVFVFMIAAVFPNNNGALVLFSLYLLSFVASIITAFMFQGTFKNEEPFVIELPPYRLPTLRHVLLRSWGEVRHFLNRATGFIALGCIAVWVLTSLPPGATGLETIGGKIGHALSPIMEPIGINPYLTLSLIFGFVAKEVVLGSLAVIYGMQNVALSNHIGETVTWVQGYSFCIFSLLYAPCLTTLVTMFNEAKSWKFTVFSLVLSLVMAWGSSFIFYQSAVALGFH